MSIRIINLHASYKSNKVLTGLTLSVDAGQMVFILGPNGAGKSTLFRCMLGQMKPDAGEIIVNDKPIANYSPKDLARRMAYIPQTSEPTYNYSVLQMAVMGRTVHISPFASPGRGDYAMALEVLNRLDIGHLADRGILEISGGEFQLALIARALVQQADILLMDEPTANLDFGNQIKVQKRLVKLACEGLTIIQSSHNPQHAMMFADSVVALDGGIAAAHGGAHDVLTTALLYRLYGIETVIENGIIMPKTEVC